MKGVIGLGVIGLGQSVNRALRQTIAFGAERPPMKWRESARACSPYSPLPLSLSLLRLGPRLLAALRAPLSPSIALGSVILCGRTSPSSSVGSGVCVW